MKKNYLGDLTEEQRYRMAEANIDSAFEYLDFLLENPDALQEIPDGSTVILPTSEPWVDEQNNKIARHIEESGETVYRVQSFG
jgi:hypothetical protein